MRKKLLCDARFAVTIRPNGPILVKSGEEQLVGPDMTFVRTKRNGKTEPYIPGTSLKGVFRSYAERIVRTLTRTDGPGVCAPGDRSTSCGNRLSETRNKSELYAKSCPACRLFGSLGFAGRIAISDAYLAGDGRYSVETRDGVAIDRHTGGAVKGAKFQLEVLTDGEFETKIDIDNFELWQLGLVTQFLDDLVEGRIRIGMGASRGLGEVTGKVKQVVLRYAGVNPPRTLVGIERLAEAERERYRLFRSDSVKPASLPRMRSEGIFTVCELEYSTFRELAGPAVEEFRAFAAQARLAG